ncbi:hypothetical protein MGAST_06065 [Mycobacterium gastri 'Wayne']|nr:hypothetical protein MGAST_06065 [Mycobacterium gastri 'Wayne']
MKHIARRRPALVETRDRCLWRVAVVMQPMLINWINWRTRWRPTPQATTLQ